MFPISLKLLIIELQYNLGSMNRAGRSQFAKKRDDTQMGTIEKMYGKDFGIRSDKQLGNYLKEIGYDSLSQLLKNG